MRLNSYTYKTLTPFLTSHESLKAWMTEETATFYVLPTEHNTNESTTRYATYLFIKESEVIFEGNCLLPRKRRQDEDVR